MNRTTILIADNHFVVIEGLRRILGQPRFEIVGAVTNGRTFLQAIEQFSPDIVIAEITMPILNGIEAARRIRKQNPRVKIIFFTMHGETVYATGDLL